MKPKKAYRIKKWLDNIRCWNNSDSYTKCFISGEYQYSFNSRPLKDMSRSWINNGEHYRVRFV